MAFESPTRAITVELVVSPNEHDVEISAGIVVAASLMMQPGLLGFPVAGLTLVQNNPVAVRGGLIVPLGTLLLSSEAFNAPTIVAPVGRLRGSGAGLTEAALANAVALVVRIAMQRLTLLLNFTFKSYARYFSYIRRGL